METSVAPSGLRGWSLHNYGGAEEQTAEGQVQPPPRGQAQQLRTLFQLLAFWAAYVLAGGFGQNLALIPGVSITFWPPAGLLIAVLLRNRGAHWPRWLLIGGLAELTCNLLWFGSPLPLAAIYYLGNALEAITAATLLLRVCRRPFRLASPREVIAFFACAALLAPMASATVIGITDAIIGKHDFATAWMLVWLGDGTGLLVSTPLALVVMDCWRTRARLLSPRGLEATVLGLILVAVSVLALDGLLPTAYLTLPPLLWIAARFQLRGASVALALLTLVTALFTAQGRGEFTGPAAAMGEKMLELQIFLGICAISALVVSALSVQHQLTAVALRKANLRLEARVHERTVTLSREQARLAVAMRAGQLGVYEWNVADTHVWWSPELFAIYGVDPATFAPTLDRFAALIHPDDRELMWSKHQQSVQTGQPFTHEYRILRPDGAVRWIFNRSHTATDRAGRVVRITGVAGDITDRREAEQALRTAKERAEAASQAKDEFLAALSHELRTPLTPVLMCASALQHDPRLPQDVREQLTMVQRNVALEARIIDDLLDLTRIVHRKLPLRRDWCDLHDIVAHALEVVRQDVEEKALTLQVDLQATRTRIHADATRLQQVLWNLLRNAIKFTPTGGRIALRTVDHAAAVEVTVQDSGIGFPSELAEQLFHPFEQGSAAGEHRFGGLGLGLAIARAIIEQHGGQICGHSHGPGTGARFTFHFPEPIAPPTDPGTSADTRPEPGPVASLAILLVEDHSPTRDILETLLRRAGHRVTTAASVSEALECAAAGHYAAVISDLGLPDGTGLELMPRLHTLHPALRGIALSGYGMDADIERSLAAGFSAHLTKPVDFEQLRSVLTIEGAGTPAA